MKKGKDIRRKINLLHLVHGLRIGGAEIALYHYIKALEKEEYNHYVYCFGSDGPVRKKLESIDVPVRMGKKRASVKQPLRFLFSLMLLIFDLLNFISEKRINIIQSHSGHANQLGVIMGKLSKIPAFPTIHSTMAFIDPRKHWDVRVYFVKMVNGVVYRVADLILAVSQEVKDMILKTYNLQESKVIILKNGIVLNDSQHNQQIRKTILPATDSILRIVAVGRLVPLKCYDILVKAMEEVVNQGLKSVKLYIVGDGEERASLEVLIQRLDLGDFIKLLGLRNDVMDIMSGSDIFVIPSQFEGLSIAMIEAMACGLPVIASDVPGLKEHVKNGVNGFLFPLNDHKELAGCIARLATDENLRLKLGVGAKETFNQEYDMQVNIKPLKKVFQEHRR